MNDWKSELLTPFVQGFLAGSVCVGGLKWGLKLLMDTQNRTDLEPSSRRRRMVGAGIILIGQLFLALGLLTFGGVAGKNPMALGLGLVGAVMLLSLLGPKSA